jgi:hypothetical protein
MNIATPTAMPAAHLITLHIFNRPFYLPPIPCAAVDPLRGWTHAVFFPVAPVIEVPTFPIWREYTLDRAARFRKVRSANHQQIPTYATGVAEVHRWRRNGHVHTRHLSQQIVLQNTTVGQRSKSPSTADAILSPRKRNYQRMASLT